MKERKKKVRKSLFLLLLLVCPCYADVYIGPENRVVNRPPGFCAWTCLEMIGRVQKLPNLSGLIDHYAKYETEGTTFPVVENQLRTSGLKYESRPPWKGKDLAFVKSHVDAGRPVLVVLTPWQGWNGGHALLAVRVREDKIWLADPNDKEKIWIFGYDKEKFLSLWCGWAIAVIGIK